MKWIRNDKGLTLIELLAVIVVLGIIAAIAVPSIGKVIENNRIKAAKSEAIIVLEAAQLYFAETPVNFGREWQTANLPVLIEEGYMEDNGYLNDTSYVTNVSPARICAGPKGKSKVTFYDATAEEIINSKHEIHVGNIKCGELELDPANKD
ncbi:prepilin-type N-terminal cleavage/methylation domain-containing protein [Sporosarcina sp. FSL W7-1349]|uniref:pilus assembly FimT family protein n=1 Tax=Sporosarcina sp. FSL W7-1349 TaxID=2921561 RepID=UPI0030FB847A